MHITGRTFSGLFEGRLEIKSSNDLIGGCYPNGWVRIVSGKNAEVVLDLEGQILECETTTTRPQAVELPEPECSCVYVDVDRVDNGSCEVHHG